MDTGDHRTTLPAFDAPPVSEAVLGIEFESISELGPIKLARLADRWQERYPIVRELPGVPSSLGRQDTGSQSQVAIHVGPPPSSRLWLLSADEADLLQLQNDRLIANWNRYPSSPEYPRYGPIRDRLERDWNDFCDFLQTEGIPTPTVAVVECTYVNSFEHEGDFSSTISFFAQAPQGMPGTEEDFQFRLVRKLDIDDAASAHLVVTGRTIAGEMPSHELTVTTRVHGAIESGNFPLRLMDEAHTASVNGFTQATTPEQHEVWKRTQ